MPQNYDDRLLGDPAVAENPTSVEMRTVCQSWDASADCHKAMSTAYLFQVAENTDLNHRPPVGKRRAFSCLHGDTDICKQ